MFAAGSCENAPLLSVPSGNAPPIGAAPSAPAAA